MCSIVNSARRSAVVQLVAFMLTKVVGVLLVLWVAGVMTGNTFGGLTHVLLVGAGVLFILRQNRGVDPLRRG